jgi:hypothetical protein
VKTSHPVFNRRVYRIFRSAMTCLTRIDHIMTFQTASKSPESSMEAGLGVCYKLSVAVARKGRDADDCSSLMHFYTIRRRNDGFRSQRFRRASGKILIFQTSKRALFDGTVCKEEIPAVGRILHSLHRYQDAFRKHFGFGATVLSLLVAWRCAARRCPQYSIFPHQSNPTSDLRSRNGKAKREACLGHLLSIISIEKCSHYIYEPRKNQFRERRQIRPMG